MRGDLYRLRSPRDTKGHEQRGARYCVVVQSDVLLRSTLLVAPTSTSAASSTTRPPIEVGGQETRVLVEQICAVAPERLGDFAGRLEPDEMRNVDDAIKIVFGLI